MVENQVFLRPCSSLSHYLELCPNFNLFLPNLMKTSPAFKIFWLRVCLVLPILLFRSHYHLMVNPFHLLNFFFKCWCWNFLAWTCLSFFSAKEYELVISATSLILFICINSWEVFNTLPLRFSGKQYAGGRYECNCQPTLDPRAILPRFFNLRQRNGRNSPGPGWFQNMNSQQICMYANNIRDSVKSSFYLF